MTPPQVLWTYPTADVAGVADPGNHVPSTAFPGLNEPGYNTAQESEWNGTLT